MDTCVLFYCLGTTDRNETELHSRWRHSNSRIAAACDGGPPWPRIDLDSGVQILSGNLLESTFICIKPQAHIMSEPAIIIILVQRPFSANGAATPYFWPIGPCIMLSPIWTHPRVGA
jgi:hypothetical protein